MIGHSALDQLCRQYVHLTNKVSEAAQSPEAKRILELKRSIELKKIKLDDAKTEVDLATAATKGLVFAKSKTKTANALAVATSNQVDLETLISNNERELLKLENVFSNHKEAQIEWFVVLTKLMVVANDLDEIVYSRVLDKSVTMFNDAAQNLHNAFRALYEVSHALDVPASLNPEYAENLAVLSRQIVSNAVMWHQPLARFSSFSLCKKKFVFEPHWRPEQAAITTKRAHQTPIQVEIGKAAGVLSPDLGLNVTNESNDPPRYS
ncbi:hypothetical protein BCR33DRAFT_713025 [Rhizoclosmatium globosum]|uniref:Uncharacterized protein n=1 Tax=Rhizoclosmatium globosum TaxID=329046 RepID=A0A1Y2CW92_9FUNG|nr:hypothetical protein BCR33DRAFT_713025 [Rhizoclosmatium globosum]|eukprot:ORY51104.1 hypothetical protein BCR33DRAFT_713025 [Rhizoclosmatium globosum]